jgi:hypothetical protein
METVKVHTLDELLAASAATEDFKEAVRRLEAGKPDSRIKFNTGAPAVKVLRTISKLLETEPGLPIDRIDLTGRSGCSDFVGKISVNNDVAVYEFTWDCAWRAKDQNLIDHFGYPDQIRAAREFKYQCFKKFSRLA